MVSIVHRSMPSWLLPGLWYAGLRGIIWRCGRARWIKAVSPWWLWAVSNRISGRRWESLRLREGVVIHGHR